jgi:hypothetical protein
MLNVYLGLFGLLIAGLLMAAAGFQAEAKRARYAKPLFFRRSLEVANRKPSWRR